MDVICPNCGASNRSTGRYCARCGFALPRAETPPGEAEVGLDLPWLQAVEEKATPPTTGLDATAVTAAPSSSEASAPASGPEVVASLANAPEGEGATREVGPSQEVEPPDAPPPGWVVRILEPSAESGQPEATYEPEELAHIMPWAYKEAQPEAEEDDTDAESESEADAQEEVGSAPGLPPWLSNVTVQETLRSVPEQDVGSAAFSELGIEDVEPFVPPVDEAAPESLPQFVRDMSGEESLEAERALPQRQVARGQTDTALEEVLLGSPTHGMPVRPPRPGAVETLAALIQPQPADASRRVVPGFEARVLRGGAGADAPQRARRGRLARWLFPDGVIYLAALATLLAVLIARPPFGTTPTPPSPAVSAFYQAVEAVPTGRPVLVVYDWDAGRSAEMSVMSRAVMHHIMSRKLSFVTVSTVPQGPGFAQSITGEMLAQEGANYGYRYGIDYLVLGYLPGNEAALRTLVGSFKAVLPLDYINSRPVDSYQLTAGGALNKIEDFALIVDLAGSEAEMRNWIEQVASRTGVPVVAAVPQGLEPLARPYLGVPGAKLSAVVSGTTGAFAYARLLEERGNGGAGLAGSVDFTSRLNAQSVAALFVALVIASAFLAQGARRILRR